MDRPIHDTDTLTSTGMFERPARAGRPDVSRFDAVSFRQSAGLTRPAPEAAEPYMVPSDGAVARPGRYAAVWAGLGVVSAIYLGAIFWQRAGSSDLALAPVTESLERMATDIAELKQTTAAIDARGRATADRLAVTETRLDGFAQMAANVPQAVAAQTGAPVGQRPLNRAQLEATPAAPAAAPPTASARIAGVELVTPPHAPRPFTTATVAAAAAPSPAPTKAAARAAAAAAAAAAKAPVNDALTSPIRTGSVPPPSAPGKPVGLLVASGPSLDSIRLSWTVLSQNHGAVLGSLEPRILPSGDGSAFQLIAGPFANEMDALKACATLKVRGVGCRSADFAGAPL